MTATLRFDEWQTSSGATQTTVTQVVQGVKRDTWSSAGDPTAFYEIGGLSATLTPTSVNSRIIVIADLHIGSGYWEIQGRLRRNGADIVETLGDTRGVRSRCTFLDNRYENAGSVRNGWGCISAKFVDFPQTLSPCTYTISLNGYSTFSLSVNFNIYTDPDSSDYFGCPISTITLMEVAG
jgi:hypothetical protein